MATAGKVAGDKNRSGKSSSGEWVEYDQFIDLQIRKTRSQVRGIEIASALMTLAAGALLFFLVAAVLDHWVLPHGLGFWGRLLALVLFLGGAGYYATEKLVPWLIYRINPIYAAQAIEKSRPTLKNSLINFLFLRGQAARMPTAVFQAVEEQAATGLSRVAVEAAVDRSRLVHIGYALLAIVGLFAVYFLFSPKNPWDTVGRVMLPWANIAAPTRVEILDVQPATRTVYRGEKIEVSAELRGLKEDEPVRVIYSTADHEAVDQPVTMFLPPDRFRYSVKIPVSAESSKQSGAAQMAVPADDGIQQDIDYRVEAGDAISPTYHLHALTAPAIALESVDYDYPAYTGRPRLTLRGIGDIQSLEGTHVTIHGRANESIKSGQLELEGHDTHTRIPLQIGSDGRTVTGGFTLALDEQDRTSPQFSHYRLWPEGRTEPESAQYRIDVIADLPPEVKFILPEKDDATLAKNRRLKLRLRALDPDFALSSLTLSAESAARRLIDESLLNEVRREPMQVDYTIDPAKLGLNVGDVVEYWAEAKDNRLPQPNSTQTSHRRIRIVANDARQEGNQGQGDGSSDGKQGDQSDNSNPANQSNAKKQNEGAGDDSKSEKKSSDNSNQDQQSQTKSDKANNPDQKENEQNNQQQRPEDKQSDTQQKQQQQRDQNGNKQAGGSQQQQQQQQQQNGTGGKSSSNSQDSQSKQSSGKQDSPEQQGGNSKSNSGSDQSSQNRQGAKNEASNNEKQSGDNSKSDKSNAGQKNGSQQQSQQSSDKQTGDKQNSKQSESGGADSHASDKSQQSANSQQQQNQRPASDGSDDSQALKDVVNYLRKKQNSGSQQNSNKSQNGGDKSDNGSSGKQNSADQKAGGSDSSNRDGSGNQDRGNQNSGNEKSDGGQQSGSQQKPGSEQQPGGDKQPNSKPSESKQSSPAQSQSGQQNGNGEQKPQAVKSNDGNRSANKPNGNQPQTQEGQPRDRADQQNASSEAGKKSADTSDGANSTKENAPIGDPSAKGENSKSGEKSDKQNQNNPADKRDSAEGQNKSGKGNQDNDGQGQQAKDGSQPTGEKSGDHQSSEQSKTKSGDADARKGNSGAGVDSTKNDKAAPPSPSDANKPKENKHERPETDGKKENASKDSGAGSTVSPKESDSKGDSQDGTYSGGGGKGGGQGAKQSGTGGPGSHSAANQGNGVASGHGQGEDSDKAGTDKKSDHRTGHSGNEAGNGSKTSSASSNRPDGGKSPKSSDQKKSSGASNQNSSTSGGNGPNGQGRSWVPRGGSAGDGNPVGQPPPDQGHGDPANAAFAKKQFDMALDNLKKGQPDLLKELNWTPEEAQRLADRLEQMRHNSDLPGAKGDEARQQLSDMLQSLGSRNGRLDRSGAGSTTDNQRGLNETHDAGPPPEYSEQVQAFQQGILQSGK
jgi:hypothetical protein